MKVAITGGTGFVGRHLAQRLLDLGHELVLVARGVDTRDLSITDIPSVEWARTNVTDEDGLAAAFSGVDAVVHCAGINRETGAQTYDAVHVEGTRNVVTAASRAGVGKIVMLSFARARPECGSAYHESKWAAEEIVRAGGIDFTIVKAGMIFGRGDHILDHLSHALFTFPVFLRVGFREKPVRPVAVADLVEVLVAALTDPRLHCVTVPVLGAEELVLSQAARRVARVIRRKRLILPAPIWFHRSLASVTELMKRNPLASRTQVRILTEGVVDPLGYDCELPGDLEPTTRFTAAAIALGVPAARRFTCGDVRWSRVEESSGVGCHRRTNGKAHTRAREHAPGVSVACVRDGQSR